MLAKATWLGLRSVRRNSASPFLAKSFLAIHSVMGRISVATRRFVRSYRFSYTRVAGDSAGQVPDAEVATGGKTASGGEMYIYRRPSSQVDRGEVHQSHLFGQILIAGPPCD